MARKPPPAAGPTKKFGENLLALKAINPDLVARVSRPADGDKFYDNSAPSTVKRREHARRNFKFFCETLLDLTNEEEMYKQNSIIDYTCHWIETTAIMASGILAEKIKVGSLYQLKQSLQWWVEVMVPGFDNIKSEWHARVTRACHRIAVDSDLSGKKRDKNDLGAAELQLFYDQIQEENQRVDNWKQHYVAWVLAFITAARPGSFTVTQGYQKGAARGGAESANRPTVKESHTLRWRDIEFRRLDNGSIVCKLTFRFSKGHQDPHKKIYVHADREFLFLPKQENPHLDLSALLFGLAYDRGLFTKPLEELLTGDEVFFQTDPEVAKQAVFVAVDSKGKLVPTQDMNYTALNPKLQEMCQKVGLLEYNSMYAFRREAATSSKSSHSLQAAQELLNHIPSNKVSFVHYDPKGMGNVDITAFRLGGEEVSVEEIRKCYSQAASRWTVRAGDADERATAQTFRQELDGNVQRRLSSHAEMDTLELELQSLLVEIHDALQGLGLLGENFNYGFGSGNVARYRKHLLGIMPDGSAVQQHPGMPELLCKLDEFMAHRKNRRKFIKRAVTAEVHKDLKELHNINRRIQKNDQQHRSIGAASVDDFELPGPEVADDEDADTDVDEERIHNTNVEPTAFANVPEGQVIVFQSGEDEAGAGGGNIDEWSRFIKRWLLKTDSEIKNSGLRCLQCAIDPTMSQASKAKEYSLWKLNAHLKSSEHSRREQFRRAFKIDAMAVLSGKVPCPFCGLPNARFTRWISHIESDHLEDMWFPRDEDDDTEDGADGEQRGAAEDEVVEEL